MLKKSSEEVRGFVSTCRIKEQMDIVYFDLNNTFNIFFNCTFCRKSFILLEKLETAYLSTNPLKSCYDSEYDIF